MHIVDPDSNYLKLNNQIINKSVIKCFSTFHLNVHSLHKNNDLINYLDSLGNEFSVSALTETWNEQKGSITCHYIQQLIIVDH